MELDDASARRIAQEAVDRAGGLRQVHGSPRHPFSLHSTREFEIEGHPVLIRYSEVSSPAVVEVGPYVFEILPDELVKLFGP